jgi:hypothetical protein
LVCIKSLKVFEEMEEEIENQYMAVEKIQGQYLVQRDRKKTFRIVHEIANGKKILCAIMKVWGRDSYPIGMERIKLYYIRKLE